MSKSLIRILVATLIVGLSPEVRAQNVDSRWTAVKALTPGQIVRIHSDSGDAVGRFVLASDQIITVSADGRDQSFDRSEVRTVFVQRAREDSTRNGMLIGATAGVAYGVGVVAVVRSGHESGEPTSAAWSAPLISGGIGAAVGYAIDRWHKRKVFTRVY